jgi:hypothetical protein
MPGRCCRRSLFVFPVCLETFSVGSGGGRATSISGMWTCTPNAVKRGMLASIEAMLGLRSNRCICRPTPSMGTRRGLKIGLGIQGFALGVVVGEQGGGIGGVRPLEDSRPRVEELAVSANGDGRTAVPTRIPQRSASSRSDCAEAREGRARIRVQIARSGVFRYKGKPRALKHNLFSESWWHD